MPLLSSPSPPAPAPAPRAGSGGAELVEAQLGAQKAPFPGRLRHSTPGGAGEGKPPRCGRALGQSVRPVPSRLLPTRRETRGRETQWPRRPTHLHLHRLRLRCKHNTSQSEGGDGRVSKQRPGKVVPRTPGSLGVSPAKPPANPAVRPGGRAQGQGRFLNCFKFLFWLY